MEPFTILLAEDDTGHARLIIRNFERTGIINPIIHVLDGQEALDYVYREGNYHDRPAVASLILLLDINMPRVDGIEVLQRIKSDSTKAKLPVVMLTTTDDPREVGRCYELGCNVYVTKPVEHDRFVEALKRLGLFLQIVQLPAEKG